MGEGQDKSAPGKRCCCKEGQQRPCGNPCYVWYVEYEAPDWDKVSIAAQHIPTEECPEAPGIMGRPPDDLVNSAVREAMAKRPKPDRWTFGCGRDCKCIPVADEGQREALEPFNVWFWAVLPHEGCLWKVGVSVEASVQVGRGWCAPIEVGPY